MTRLRFVLAEKLRNLMTTTPLLISQRKVGEASGVAQSTVGRILSGEVAATLDNIEAIAGAFRVSPVELLTVPAKNPGKMESLIQVCQRMPRAELEEVLAFARYVEMHTPIPASRVRSAVNELSIDRLSAPSDAERREVQRGANAPLHAQEMNQNGTERGTTRRATVKRSTRRK